MSGARPEPTEDELFTVTTIHRAPRELVFAALTEPEHLQHFWGPVGTHTPADRIVVELRVGGRFETTMINDANGQQHTMRAVYLDVERPGLLRWRETDSAVVTEIVLTDRGDGTTEVITTQYGLPPARRSPQARAGWRTALDRSVAYTATLAPPQHDLHPSRSTDPNPGSRP
ncbi:uncharacterized protein YndB with AHSA1/START domain [Friedmanniella endophytica]|uniref:Uncharacterized protein YndB with AHSA1/START domain n=1 Tax=Microlunatus kandeliicorticis TaxID=1759536 RepID=A0A7W3IPP9_9ACTN|nr:SRPBCC domain-containing protein [Microlunatus kandeliicorticis]MBA8792940.1 uncharacterized protein YndB with AHSA1/START domain [Microlunatus kandeliicorticis]